MENDINYSTESTQSTAGTKKNNRIVEFFRKFMVGLKRHPQNISIFVYVIALLVFSLPLTKISNSTAYIQLTPMGLCEFVIMLFSILGFVCILGTYPKRGKPKYFMLALFLVMMCVVILCDVLYIVRLTQGINNNYDLIYKNNTGAKRQEEINKFITEKKYLFDVISILYTHIVLVAVSVVLFVLSPTIGKLLKKVNTSVSVDLSEEMAVIERESEE